MRVAFYVSGHGYGHATRMSEVIRELRAQRPGLSVFVRSAAPAFLFPEDVEYSPSSLEPGIAESTDALRILPAETARLLAEFFPREHDVVQQEAAWVRGKRIRFIVADIPFLAGRVAAAAGVPCAGISNFTWDWIYEPHLHADPRWPEWDRRIRDGYSGFDALLKLPFAQPSRLEPFGRIVEVPLIGRRGAAAVSNRRPHVLVGMRAAVERGVLQRAIAECPEFEFIEAGSGARFQDLAASSTVVIAKLG